MATDDEYDMDEYFHDRGDDFYGSADNYGYMVSSDDHSKPLLSEFVKTHKEKFQDKYKEINEKICDKNFTYLAELVSKENTPQEVNLSDDPVLSVVIAYDNSDLAVKLVEKMPVSNLMASNIYNDTALHVAAAKGDVRVVEALVNKCNELMEMANLKGETPLHKAALYGERDTFWKLVELGSDIEYRKADGSNMLHYAVTGNAPDLATEIAKGYPEMITSRNTLAATPLHLVLTIPEAFRSKQPLGPLDSFIYNCIPLEEEAPIRMPKGVGEQSEKTTLQDEEKQSLMKLGRKFPEHYSTLCDLLEWTYRFPVTWIRLLVINVLKPMFPSIEGLQRMKQNHRQTVKLINLLAGDSNYWEFFNKGADPSKGTKNQSRSKEKQGSNEEKFEIHLTDIVKCFSQKKVATDNLLRWLDSPLLIGAKMGLDEPVKQIFKKKLIHLEEQQGSEKEKFEIHMKNVVKCSCQKKDLTNSLNRWDESPLLIAAKMGLDEFVKQILAKFPQSAQNLDSEGRNVLQVAIKYGWEQIVNDIESMISGKNPILPSGLLSSIHHATGNTILHFAAEKVEQDEGFPREMQYELQFFERVKEMVPRDLLYNRNKSELTAEELFTERHKDMLKRGKEQLAEMGKTCSGLVVAVVFASTFSIPGDKDANQNPIFLHRTAFKVFSHAYVIGLSSAATSFVLFLSFLNSSNYKEQDFRRFLPIKYLLANMSFYIALVALFIAFSCNIYLQIYGGKPAETKYILPFVSDLAIFPAVCLLVFLHRSPIARIRSFLRCVWR